MILAIHGAAGGWDELVIALVAFGVMWMAVKLAGRKANADDDDDDDEAVPEPAALAADAAHRERKDPAPPAAPRA
jgi:cell division septation protein DedD